MSDLRQNPFPVLDAFGRTTGWKWRDELGDEFDKTYPTQRHALHALIKYCDFLDNGPNLWQRVWWPVRYSPLWKKVAAFWNDESTVLR